jgi:hypothetical protein
MTTKIIYAHVSKGSLPLHSGLVLPLVVGAIGMLSAHFLIPYSHTNAVKLCERVYIWCYFAMCVVGYGNWIYHTIRSICLHCDIFCFKIKEKQVVTPAQPIFKDQHVISATPLSENEQQTPAPYLSTNASNKIELQ